MAVLVTGASGFLGGALARRLGSDVVGLGRDAGRLAALGVQTVALDLSCEITPEQFRDVDTIVHCAALSAPWGAAAAFERNNVMATRNVLALGVVLGVRRFVHISTPSVYFRFADQEGLAENAALPPPVNAYAETKLRAEGLVLSADLPTIVLRPRAIYGAGDRALLPRLMRVAAKRALPRFAAGMGATDMTHVDDVVDAVLAALRAEDVGGIFNISGGEALEMERVIEAACRAEGIVPLWRVMPFAPVLAVVRGMERVAAMLPGRPEPPVTAYGLGLLRYRQTLDISKAAEVLGWRPRVSFEEGLRRTFGAVA